MQIRLFDADLPTLIQMVEAGKLDMSLGIFKLEGETLILLSRGHPHQQLIDHHLTKAGVKVQSGLTVG